MIRIWGFARAGLIQRLLKKTWQRCKDGNNFLAIDLGSYCLTQPADELCSRRYEVSVRNMETDEEFSIVGYGHHSMLGVMANVRHHGLAICGRRLHQEAARHLQEYVITIKKF